MAMLFSLLFFFLFLLPHRLSSATSLEYTMEEELPVGSVVGNVRQDLSARRQYPDSTLSLPLRFRFQHPACEETLRLDDATGQIRIHHSSVDRDSLCPHDDDDGHDRCVIDCDVIVRSAEFYDVIPVVFVIDDVNDNAPRFPPGVGPERVEVEVPESVPVGRSVPLPTAEDADGPGFGISGYALHGDEEGTFELRYSERSDTLRLHLLKPLDRERVARYSLRLVAADGGSPPRTADLDLDLVVRDDNDNAPRLAGGETLEATLEENLPVGTRILQVRADDPDEGRNAELEFRFADDTRRAYGDVFRIDRKDGWIHVIGVVDYERDHSLVLNVVVADQGVMALTSYAKVAIYVSDANDNDPVIKVSSFEDRRAAEIYENRPPGTFVAHVVVTDADGSDNGRVTCHIDNPRFRLTPMAADDQSEYQLVSAEVFDREDRPLGETVSMSCRDHGHPPRSATASIDAWIVDENDNDPRFLPLDPSSSSSSSSSEVKVMVKVNENNAVGDQLALFNATDPDEGPNAELDFTVEGPNGTPSDSVSVSVDRRGVVTASTVFDFEARQVHAYVIVATDRGLPARSTRAHLEIQVVDVNDEIPTFDANTYVFRTRENLPPGTLVGKVRAVDRDLSPEFRLVFYSFAEDQTHLSIGANTGEITVSKPMDRENQSSVTVKVRASNDPDLIRSSGTGSGSGATVDVMVYVEDENDNSPVVTFPGSGDDDAVTLRVDLGVKAGDRVAKVDAFDLDEGENANLTFTLVDETAGGHGVGGHGGVKYFGVEPSTGWIVVADGFNEESFSGVRLTVHVTDQGRPPRSSTGTLVLLPKVKVNEEEEEDEEEEDKVAYGWRRSIGSWNGSWTLVGVGVSCGTLCIAMVVVVVVVCLRVRRSEVKNRRSYNCRLEANRANTGSLNRYTRYSSCPAGEGTAAPPGDELGCKAATRGAAGKRAVRFNLDPECCPFISPPITDCKLSCPFPNECILHRQGSQNSTDYSPSPSSSCSLQDPFCAFEADGQMANGKLKDRPCHEPFPRYQQHAQQQQRQQQQPSFAVPRLPQRILRKVEMPSIDRILFSRDVRHQGGCGVWTASYPAAAAVVVRPLSSASDRWLNRSLSDSGQGLSDGEGSSGVFYPGSQEPFFPAESNV